MSEINHQREGDDDGHSKSDLNARTAKASLRPVNATTTPPLLAEETFGNRGDLISESSAFRDSVRENLEMTRSGRETLHLLETIGVKVYFRSRQGTFHQALVIHIEAATPAEAAIKLMHEAEHAIRYACGSSPSPSTTTKRQFVNAKLTEEVAACVREYEHCVELVEASHELTYRPSHFNHFHQVYQKTYARATSRHDSAESAKDKALAAVFIALKRVIRTGVADVPQRELYPDYYARLWEETRRGKT